MYHYNILFEFDPEKSRQNLEKHGISFEEAKVFWTVPGVHRDTFSSTESRWIRISPWEGKFYTCVFTVREGRIRIISVRRSRGNEEKIYQKEMAYEKEIKEEQND